MNKRRLLTILLTSVSVITAAAGCAGNGGQTQAPSESAGESASAARETQAGTETQQAQDEWTLHFMMPYAENHALAKTIAGVVAKYQETHPEFVYHPEYISDSEAYYQKLKILISSNEAPDWFFGDPDTFTEGLRDMGMLYDIGGLIEELGIRDYFMDITYEYPKYDDGSLYLMATGANTEYFFYHPSLFEKAGVEPPKTFNEFFEVCDKLKEAGITPLSAQSDPWYLLRFAAMVPYRMTKNEFIDSARTGQTSFHSEAGIKAGEFVQQISQYFVDGWAGNDASTARDYFLSGGAAMWYNPTSSALDYVTDENQEWKEDIAYFTMPTLDGYNVTAGTDYFANSGKGIAMLADSMSVEMKDFVKFFVENFGDTAFYENNYISGIKPENTTDISDCYKELLDNFSKVGPQNYAYCWDVRMDAASNEVLKAETVNLAIGEITPEEWADRIDKAVKENAGN
ncbi:ABC transporter substrate-binding protein [Clostridium sp. MCC353]|uniref:ABC transporter substrate-binding protein n=1 Tax=Clostridium sp. MCC353 TaxID=2592646 RepID=UPI001C01BDA3|nr:ABC transporter substrate-binding protein [Clostridium sp. MCC353]